MKVKEPKVILSGDRVFKSVEIKKVRKVKEK